jgi:eukaryotic-like serine/threonine-protein kinase
VSAPHLAPGQVVAGKYAIRAMLGYGGASATYAATIAPGREVVVKVFSLQLAQRSDVLGALQQVAAVTNGLADSTAPILESGFDTQTGTPFMVTDLVLFPSLTQAVQSGPLTTADVLLLLRGIARPVDAAHAQRLTHGALKPNNVFLGPAPQRAVRVIDFGVGVARAALHTNEGFAVAAPWMAPEQMQGTPGGAPSDIFSAALIAFFAATGRSYWRSCQGPSPNLAAWQQEIVAARVAPSVRARELGANLPPGFDAPLLRALALNPAERFASLGELTDALASAGGPGSQKMAMTMPLGAMPQAVQDLLRQHGAGAGAAAPQYGGGTTLAVQSPADAQWPPPPHGPQGPSMQQPQMQQPPMQQPPGQQFPQQGAPRSAPGGEGGMAPAPMAAFQSGSPPVMQGAPQPRYSLGPRSESVVLPKSKTGLFIVLALVAVLVIGGAVGVIFMLQRRAAIAAIPPVAKPDTTQSAAGSVPPPAESLPIGAQPPVETQDAAAGAVAAQGTPEGSPPTAGGPDGGAAAVAELTIVCSPECDSVKIDDRMLDTNDAGVVHSEPVEVAAGAHVLAVGRATYVPQTKKVTLKAGQKVKETFYLSRPGAVALPRPCGKFLERCPN